MMLIGFKILYGIILVLLGFNFVLYGIILMCLFVISLVILLITGYVKSVLLEIKFN